MKRYLLVNLATVTLWVPSVAGLLTALSHFG